MEAFSVEHWVTGSVGVLKFDNPRKHNAITVDSLAVIENALRALADHPDCVVIVLAGNGPSFCTGMQLGTKFGGSAPGAVIDTYAQMRAITNTLKLFRSVPQPLIAAVHGHATGAGFAFAAAADVRVAHPDASFDAVFVKIGMTPGDVGLSWFLPRLIGPSAAAELFLTGGSLSGTEAHRLGLVSRLADDPLQEALTLAEQVARGGPFAIRQTKELLNASVGWGLQNHLELELRSQVVASATGDFVEAVSAFTERRAPEFKDQ